MLDREKKQPLYIARDQVRSAESSFSLVMLCWGLEMMLLYNMIRE